MRRLLPSIVLALLVSVCVPATVQAHNVGLDCTRRLRHFEVEVFYDDDTAAQKAKVQVVNAKEEVVADGLTDAKGRWSFRKPAPGKYEVRADAGAGHRAKKKLEVPDSTAAEALSGVLLDLSIVAESAAPIAAEQTPTDGDSPVRTEFTRTPWLRIVIGLIVIGGLAGAFLIASLIRRKTNGL